MKTGHALIIGYAKNGINIYSVGSTLKKKKCVTSKRIFQSYSIGCVNFNVKNAIIEGCFAQEFMGKVCSTCASCAVCSNWCFYKAA